MNPQFPGQYGQGPQPIYRGPPGPGQIGGQRPPMPNMYNGLNMAPPGQFGGPQQPPKTGPGPVQNGPQQGSYSGPQGDNFYGAGPPTSMQNKPAMGQGQFQPPSGLSHGGGPMPPSSMGMQRGPTGPNQPPHMGPPLGPPTSTGQIANQMGAMSLSGSLPPPGPGPKGNQPPTSMGPGSGMLLHLDPRSPTTMGPPPTSSTASPHSMGMPPSSRGMPPSGIGMPPSNMGGQGSGFGSAPPQASHMLGSMPPTSMGMPPTNMGMPLSGQGYGGPPHAPGGMVPGYATPLSSVETQSGMNLPPPSSFSGSATSGSTGYNQQPAFAGGLPPNQYSSFPGGPSLGPGASQPGSQPPPQQGQFIGANSIHSMQPYSAGMGGAMPPGSRQPVSSMQPPQQKRLDPDQMPSPIQVIEDDRRNRGGTFQTSAKGGMPPLVTTDFITQDQGNCNPAFLRSTMYNIPCTSDMMKSSNIPIALTVSPFANLKEQETTPPLVDLGEVGPVRCKRCKAYMNSYNMFIDGGRRFQCAFCGAATDVPNEYFAHLDHTGKRTDCYSRPELCLGSYDFVATKDYCKNGVLPQAPAFIFMIDVSYNSVKTGLVNLICERLKSDILVNLPKEAGSEESEIRVGFVTYAKEIHFYNVKGSLAQPQMLVVSDLEDVFVPLLDGFLVKLSESEAVIDSLLQQIPEMFVESRETEIVLGPVIQAGLDALKAAERSGKLFIFHTSLPIAEAPGKLKNRDDRKLLGTEKEKTILSPQTNFYTKLGQDCVSAACSVDIFLFPNSYVDVATIAEVCRLTGGNMYKYSYFQCDIDGDRFIEDLKQDVKGQRAFDAIMRIRTSTGIRPVDFFGNFFMSNTTDVELCAIDCYQAVTMEIKHDDKLNESDGAFIQVAVLYTSITGQRRLRVHNLSLNCCVQLADLFRSCELDTLVNYMAKFAIRNVLNKTPKDTREHIMTQTAEILACYRKNCASPSSAGQLILPECMKLLPLYANCVIKNDGIQGGTDISTDDRSYLMHMISSMDVKSSCVFFYPRLLPIHNLDPHSVEFPAAIRCSSERLQDDGVYILENGISMFMWIGHNVDPAWVKEVFGVQSAAQIDIDKCRLMDLDNPTSQRVRDLIKRIRSERHRYMKLTVVRQRDNLEPWFNHFLVEDKGLAGSASYVDFLCHIHKEIRNLLN
ncbi:hypothetical protein ACJMK2_033741 [Sinanodonta woodiana]|uniref:Protein transport protein Sec24C n=1 Tax=Sinanodonta woodiana TaxID=1069815 RepID=A0ABD3WSU9_SINWO